MKHLKCLITSLTLVLLASYSMIVFSKSADFQKQVNEYIKNFPYQDTYHYALAYTKGDPAKLNVWVMGMTPKLLKAGEDKVVRSNNDTYYKLAFLMLDKGPVMLTAKQSAKNRFYSFQLMDDRNANFKNIIFPHGVYTIYYGNKPKKMIGKAIESPSKLAVVIVRVEVKNKKNAKDVKQAKTVFNGISINGPKIGTFPKLDLLAKFSDKVKDAAMAKIQKTAETTDFSQLVAGPNDVPGKVSYLQLAAGTKVGWGGPVSSHSAYETLFVDKAGNKLEGRKGIYFITTTAPPVGAFWSLTVYDTGRGGFFHPNKDNRYHINNTTAIESQEGNYTFAFKQKCIKDDINCIAVPAGQFDIAVRYYLPKEAIINGQWKIAKPELVRK